MLLASKFMNLVEKRKVCCEGFQSWLSETSGKQRSRRCELEDETGDQRRKNKEIRLGDFGVSTGLIREKNKKRTEECDRT